MILIQTAMHSSRGALETRLAPHTIRCRRVTKSKCGALPMEQQILGVATEDTSPLILLSSAPQHDPTTARHGTPRHTTAHHTTPDVEAQRNATQRNVTRNATRNATQRKAALDQTAPQHSLATVAPDTDGSRAAGTPLIKLVGVLKRELGVSGPIRKAVHAAAMHLGVATEGVPLHQIVAMCMRELGKY